jgi:AcrR family transcriptional regulator
MDRRNRKSQRVLKDALLALLRRTPYEEITIQNITDEADTARVTFYRHYSSKEELLLDALEDIRHALVVHEDAVSLSFDYNLDLNNPPPTLFGFLLIDADRPMVRNVFTSPAQNFVRRSLYQIMTERILLQLADSPQYADLPAQVIATHIATVVIGYMFWWVEQGFPLSAEAMARLAHSASICGALKLVGRDDLITMPSPNVWDFPAGAGR